MPHARRREAVVWVQVMVRHGRMGALATRVVEMDPDMRFEGAFVGREPGVAANPEERAPRGAWVGDEMSAERAQVRRETGDEEQR